MLRYVAAMGLLLAGEFVFAQEPPFGTGLEFLDPGQYEGIPLATPSYAAPLPGRVDLAPFAIPGNQGRQGSCVGWAVAYGLKTYQEEMERRWGVSTADHQFSPSFVFNQIKRNLTCSGSLYVDALNVLTRDGAATLAEFPYDETRCDESPSTLIKQRAAPFRVATWRRVNTHDEAEVKTHLAQGLPVLIGMPVDSAFMNLRGDSVYQGLSGPSLGGHAMLAVGYDDSKGAFRLLNSWGDSWSDGGFGWIAYPAFRGTVREGYVVLDIIANGGADPKLNTQIEFETVVFAGVPAGIRSVSLKTADHHCSSNCQGEPTRTNYTLSLSANDGASLRDPQLRCVSGPCHGWNAVRYVRLEDENRRVSASWDVWTTPTSWELTADEVHTREVSRFTRRVDTGTQFVVVSQNGAPPPRVTGRFPTGETFSFVVGQPTLNERLRLLSFEVQGQETVYQYASR